MLTQYSTIVFEATYLYCFAIGLLLQGKSSEEVYNVTKKEAADREEISGNVEVSRWFKYEIENNDESDLVVPHERPISNVKIPFVWAFYYLKNNFSFEDALRDIIKRGYTLINPSV